MNEETLFHLTLKKPPAERSAFLEQVCGGDSTLRAHLEALLQAHNNPGGFLETPAVGLPTALLGERMGVRGLATLAEPPVVECPGAVIGPYRLVKRIGEGGMGTVFLAEQTQPVRRQVALKILKPGMDQPARGRAEAEAVARLEHRNIVQLYEVLENHGRPCLALEYVPGITLQERLKEKPVAVEEAARLVETLARAIHYAHQNGIVHRDLKPANILLPSIARTLDDGEALAGLLVAKITDFGLAKLLDADQGQTPSGAILGTPSYMAPEQARGTSKRSGPAADIYSLGAILYELLVGEPPFRGETLVDTLVKAISQKPVSPRRRESEIPAELERICLKCLRKDPAGRYPSAEALAEDLRRFLAGQPVPDEPPSVADPERGPQRTGGLRRRLLLAGGIAALLVVGLVLLFRAASRPWASPAQDGPGQPPVGQLPPPVANPQAQLLGQKRQETPLAPQNDPRRPPEHGKESPQKKDAQQAAAKKLGATPGGALDALLAWPDMQISLPALPPRGWLAVQASSEVHGQHAQGNGTIVLVLDCSGSMAARQPAGMTRLDQARMALKRVLAEIPPGIKVSVWAFSQRFDVNNPNRRFDPGAGVDPEQSIQRLHSAPNWDRTMLKQLGPRLDRLEPFNETPIVRAMMEACQDFTGARGLKTLVVLTDGMDNRFQMRPPQGGKPGLGDAKYNPNGQWTIPEFLVKEFGKKDIAIRIVGFQLPEDEQAIARRQFEEPLKKLRTKGQFYLVDNMPRLSAALRESLARRLCFSLQDSNGRPVKGFDTGVEITRKGSDSAWAALAPGSYQLVIHARQEVRQNVRIGRGDRLRLNLYAKGDDFALERDPMQKLFPGKPFPRGEARDWLVTVLQNQRLVQEDALQMAVTAEKLRAREFGGGTLGHVRPRLILFQVRPKDDPKAQPPNVRYYTLADYTAPAWGLDIKPWERGKTPVLEAFWSEDPPPVAGVLRRGQHFGDDLQVLPDNTLDVQLTNRERGTVQLLSISIEKHPVDTVTTARTGKQEEVACLVVRMTFPPGKPLMAQLPWEEFSGGQEHRFYTAAGKYTGLFWPRKGDMTLQQAQQEVQSLNLISLEGFREAALAAGQHTRIELPEPNHNPRPRPPQ